MAIGYIEQCLNGVPGVEGNHVHHPDIRTVDTADEFVDVLTAKFVRAALEANVGGCAIGYRNDAGSYNVAFVYEGEVEALIENLSIDEARDWFQSNAPRCYAIRAAAASTTLN